MYYKRYGLLNVAPNEEKQETEIWGKRKAEGAQTYS